MNRTTLIGRLGNDPQVSEIASGLMATFSVATNEYWTDRDGRQQKHTEWHQVVCYDNLAANVRDFLQKGFEVYIEGRVRTTQWTDGEGRKRTDRELRADVMRMLRAPRRDATTAVCAQLTSIEQLARDLQDKKRDDCTFDDLANMIATARESLIDAAAA